MMAQIPSIQTERLLLRAPMRSDFGAYAAMLGSDRTQFMGGPYSRDGAWDMFCNMIAGWHLSGFGGWLINAKDDQMVGEVTLWYPDRFPEPELGWTLTQAGEGKGFAYEAACAVREWYWRTTGAQTLVSYITPGNTRSEALARRMGAQPDPDAALPFGETERDTTVFRHPGPAVVSS